MGGPPPPPPLPPIVSTVLKSIYLLETSLQVISAENETIQDLNNMALGFYSPLLVFKRMFYVRCVELVSNISGTVNLKVSSQIYYGPNLGKDSLSDNFSVNNQTD